MPQLEVTAELDLGDRYTYLCLIDTHSGEIIEVTRLVTSPVAFERRFSTSEPIRAAIVAIEASTHSPWVSRLLESCGHEVLVANARKVRLIYGEGRKSDKLDSAHTLHKITLFTSCREGASSRKPVLLCRKTEKPGGGGERGLLTPLLPLIRRVLLGFAGSA